MNRFATSSEPGGTRRPAPSASGRRPDADVRTPLRRAYDAATGMAKGIAGLDAYERYVQHRTAQHPDDPLQSEAEFWRCRWDAEGSNPTARCC
jgi:uncharacterized short protein YbdD (DUF466 family)